MKDFAAYEPVLSAMAAHYDLTADAGRRRSNEELAQLFIEINGWLKPEVTYEIGAFGAGFSLDIKKLFKNTKAIAFEASPYNFDHFSVLPEIVASGIDYIHLAITDKTGRAEFQVQTRIDDEKLDPVRANNSLLARTPAGVDVVNEYVSVPTMSLADYIAANGLQSQNFTAWIDAEGASEQVLKGGGDVWKNCKAVFIEVEQHRYWENQWLAQDAAGFLIGRGFVPVARDFEYEQQYNLIFVHDSCLNEAGMQKILRPYWASHLPRGIGFD